MRAAAAAVLLALCAASAAHAADGPPTFPTYDLEGFCREQARYSFAATLGDSSFERVLANCEASERDARRAALALWTTASSKTMTECPDLARGRYTYLMRCLDSSRTMRTAR